ncbi:MAG: PEP-CTERM sorting domain-containing protein [Thermoguttaceae bacterium]|nr:PEP-CTERM sorting domain-containing protein [Thermoguttaceae bacterium]
MVPSGSNCYYLNNNLDGGSVLVGQINFGGRRFDRYGNELNALSMSGLMPTTGAKSLLRSGDYYYITNQDGGIGRFDATGADAWSAASFQGPLDPGGIAAESIVTDGTLIYTNDDAVRYRIHAFTVSDPFDLTEAWSVDLPDEGRVRGLSYHADSGYLYMHNGGAGAAQTTLYAVDTATQTVYSMGSHDEGGITHQVLRRGNELLVFGYSDNMTAYKLLDDTTIGAQTSQVDLGVGDIYGAAILGNRIIVASAGSKLSAFQIVPEPGSMLLLAFGAAGLLCWPRRRARRRSRA